jgi:hypothetical protein
MRGSMIWFVLAAFWGFDSGLALFHHNRVQAGLTAFFACCFLGIALALRKREQKALRR